MKYQDKLDLINSQICGRSEFDEALKKENQKLFPFSLFTNFNTNGNKALKCDYTLTEEEGNYAGYYMMYIVFESENSIKLCSNIHELDFYDEIYQFGQQIYGEKKPISLPTSFLSSFKHRLVWFCVFGQGAENNINIYRLKKFINGISNDYYNKTIKPVCQGGSGLDGGHYTWDSKGMVLDYYDKTKSPVKINTTSVISIINEIIVNNTQGEQLSLF